MLFLTSLNTSTSKKVLPAYELMAVSSQLYTYPVPLSQSPPNRCTQHSLSYFATQLNPNRKKERKKKTDTNLLLSLPPNSNSETISQQDKGRQKATCISLPCCGKLLTLYKPRFTICPLTQCYFSEEI